jgi:hypothetical protein
MLRRQQRDTKKKQKEEERPTDKLTEVQSNDMFFLFSLPFFSIPREE